MQESSIIILKNKNYELKYSQIANEEDYFLDCPIFKSFHIEIKQAIYYKDYNDYHIFSSCGSSENLFSNLIKEFFILNNNYENIYLTKHNSEMEKNIK